MRTLKNEPEIIYHYTGIEGLRGILESKSLWATDFHFSNDYTEMCLFGKLLLTKLSLPGNSKIAIMESVINGMRGLLENMDDPLALQIYISSFPKEGDLLSQWRGYGEYAIGFDYKN
jgi:hypothetical protein